MLQSALGVLTIPFSICLIGFLAYPSQYLFHFIEPGPLTAQESLTFNCLVICTYVGYFRSCFTNPGWVPKDWRPSSSESTTLKPKWCKKCQAPKPPRAHHCKICARCIPKMDHHCPWTTSCISHRTMPHFCRFLFYGTTAMLYLSYLLYQRLAKLWEARNLPSYLGPSIGSLILLFALCVANFMTLFGVGLLLLRNLWSVASNVTTIESWEIERHENVFRKARARGGYLPNRDGTKIKIQKQEFPYDIGIWSNIVQGMGGSVLLWLWPLTSTPANETGLAFETNGFEDPSIGWPPPDPERHASVSPDTALATLLSSDNYVEEFRERQRQDLKRRRFDGQASDPTISSEKPRDFSAPNTLPHAMSWADSDGDQLRDFGVDEEVDLNDDDSTPLAEVLRDR